MKKMLIILALVISFIKADIWESSWVQGHSIYNLTNDSNDNLRFECGKYGSSVYLNGKNKDKDLLEFIFNKSKKYTIVSTLGTNLIQFDILYFDKFR